MTAHAETAHGGSNKLYVSVWLWLVAMTLIEVFLAYEHVPLHIMLVLLLGLSLVKAVLIVSYFMHLRWDKVFCTILFFIGLILAGFTMFALLHLFGADASKPLSAATLEFSRLAIG